MTTALVNNPITTEVQSATVTWIGTSGDWYNAANWSTGTVPTINDIVTIGNSTKGTTYEITFSNGNPAYGGLNLLASNGGILKLTGLTNYQGSSLSDIKIEATGQGSLIDLSDVTTLKGGTLNTLKINALQGGEVNLSELTKITGGTTEVVADGTLSTINLVKLTEFIDDDFDRSLLKTRNAGFINLAAVTKLQDVDLSSENSVLYLESLTTYDGDNLVEALNGGQISLINLNTVTGQILPVLAAGTNSRIVISEQLEENKYLIQERPGGDVIISNNSSALNYSPFVRSPIATQTTNEDQAFNFTIPATTFVDLDPSDILIYTATLTNGSALPSWLSFSAVTRTFSGTPNNDQIGTLDLTVKVTDKKNATASSRFNLNVVNVNDAPVVLNPLPEQSIFGEANFTYTFAENTFGDVDAGDMLTYSATLESGADLPSWLSFDAATRTFSGTPTNADAGTINVSVKATDKASASVTDTFAITIVDLTNKSPVVDIPLVAQSTLEDQLFTFQVPTTTFSDPNAGDVLTYSATLADGTPLPSWLTFDLASDTFSGTPSNENVGVSAIAVIATDPQGLSVTSVFNLTVNNVNDSPTLNTPISNQDAIINRSFSYVVPNNTFTDVDLGDSLTYSATKADGTPIPAWLTFDPLTLTFSGIAPVADYGTLGISVTASDTSSASVSSTFELNIDIDAAQYGASYNDLIDAFGDNLTAFSQHYRDFGRTEGRNPDIFEEYRYVASNPELIPVIGTNSEAAAVNYITEGYAAGKQKDTFDSYRYLAGYDDLLDFYNQDAVGATVHYITYGAPNSVPPAPFQPENRDPLKFKSDIYIASYGDLIEAVEPISDYSEKLKFAGEHYVLHGIGEGRDREKFDPTSYLALRPDVAQDPFYGSDPTRHYIEHGYFESKLV
ncbi:hypothetical protein C7H19_23250 [Aphanothece hegewaldii CCALA 016]|uniref:Dystroglycan-type cadherin-like domain-containing protein n=1 Tax=Aphanothece hegewaldii CCALA 016 TaxID=2107694 RepID=A0A2T1LRC2_9CHRO|nr:putative Ig domain-containing protein [Aphanothece hegewaldii]PSF31178.1 hypothetical protein C7H19_23250 [Aphanothece hegewaldii CCALA 016]